MIYPIKSPLTNDYELNVNWRQKMGYECSFYLYTS
jgi:hypothetical protein